MKTSRVTQQNHLIDQLSQRGVCLVNGSKPFGMSMTRWTISTCMQGGHLHCSLINFGIVIRFSYGHNIIERLRGAL